jgi:hypothetical protein
MNKNITSLYVVAQVYKHSHISLFSGQVHDSKEAAEAEENKVPQEGNVKVMTLEDYIQEYGDNRYDEGASGDGN